MWWGYLLRSNEDLYILKKVLYFFPTPFILIVKSKLIFKCFKCWIIYFFPTPVSFTKQNKSFLRIEMDQIFLISRHDPLFGVQIPVVLNIVFATVHNNVVVAVCSNLFTWKVPCKVLHLLYQPWYHALWSPF